MKTITLLHPFTPQAAGVVEQGVAQYHSQPHVKAMAALAQQTGYHCRMEYFTPKWRGYGFNHFGVDYRFYPVSFTWNGDHKKWKKQFSKSCYKAYQKNTPDVTIINMSGHSSPFSFELSKLILQQGKKYIAMLGGRHYTNNDWARKYYHNAHHILVHTQTQKKQMQSKPLFEGCDIRVLPLGVGTDVFSLPKTKNNSTISLLYVGRISEIKRVHLAIQVVAELVRRGVYHVILRIVGPVFSEKYQKELEKMVIENKLTGHVLFEGFKPHNETISYFHQADLLLLPSESESFGMVVTEAMSCGVPAAVIEGVVGPEEIITNKIDGAVFPLDKYVTQTADLALDKSRLNQMQQNARQKVINEYSIQKTTEVLMQSVADALII